MATTPIEPASAAQQRRQAVQEIDRARKQAMEHLQRASSEIEEASAEMTKARQGATAELRRSLDSALDRLREVRGDLRRRAEDQLAEWQETLEHAPDEARREMGRRAIRVQRTPEALKELSAEIRKREADLVTAAKGNGAEER